MVYLNFPLNLIMKKEFKKIYLQNFIVYMFISPSPSGKYSYLYGDVTSGTLKKPSNKDIKKYMFTENENLLSNYKVSLSKDDL